MEPSELPLRDLHLPDAVGWWPLAPGWWGVIAIALLLFGWFALRVWRNWQFNAPRRHALRRLEVIEAEYLKHRNPVVLGKALSELLRRAMLAYTPREDIAGLTGNAWLEWLDHDLPVPCFHTEGGRSLLKLPYRNPDGDIPDVDVNALLTAVRMRIARPFRGDR